MMTMWQGEFVAIGRLEATYSGNSELIQQMYIYGSARRAYLLAAVVPSKGAPSGLAQAPCFCMPQLCCTTCGAGALLAQLLCLVSSSMHGQFEVLLAQHSTPLTGSAAVTASQFVCCSGNLSVQR